MTLNFYSKAFNFSLGLFSLIICFAPILPPVVISLTILLFSVLTVIGFVKKTLLFDVKSMFWPFILFYLIYIVGIAFSLDTSLGLKYAEYKLFFLLIPLLFSFRPQFELSLKWPTLFLSLSCIVISIYGFFHAFACFETYPYVLQCFTSSNFSAIHHPSYFSVYLLFSIFALWKLYAKSQNKFLRFSLILYSIFALVMYILCFSMAGFLFIALVALILGFLYLKRKYNLTVAFLVPALIAAIVFIAAFSTEGFSNEVNATAKSVKSYLKNKDNYFEKVSKQIEINGDDTRIIVWLVTFELIKEYPLGAGTGSLDIIITEKLRQKGLIEFSNENYNPHNQYLQTTLEIGFIGLLILLLIFYLGIREALKYRSLVFLILVLAFLFHSNFESMFQRQSGIFFFVFWVCLLSTYFKSRIEIQISTKIV